MRLMVNFKIKALALPGTPGTEVLARSQPPQAIFLRFLIDQRPGFMS